MLNTSEACKLLCLFPRAGRSQLYAFRWTMDYEQGLKMKTTLSFLFGAGILALASSSQAAYIITANNSYVEGYLYIEDTNGNSAFENNGEAADIYMTEFWGSQGTYFDSYSLPPSYDYLGNPVYSTSSGTSGGDQHSIYDDNHIYGDGFAVADVSDPNNELSFVQVSGQSLVDVTFEISSGYNYTLTGDLSANPFGSVDLLFEGNSASELDGTFSFSGYLAAGTYTLSIDALAVIDDGVRATSGFNYDLQLTAVPVPAAVWLFASGAVALFGVSRRKLSDE